MRGPYQVPPDSFDPRGFSEIRNREPKKKSLRRRRRDLLTIDRALYIKLGQRGTWERECIEQKRNLRLGYQDMPHSLCCEGAWDRLVKKQVEEMGRSRGVASRHVKQIRFFYEAGDDVLWVTFYNNRLWWCFSNQQVTQLPDGSKTRPVIGRWRSDDIKGRPLDLVRLSGKLMKMQGYRGTICEVRELDYLVRKINAKPHPEIEAASAARSILVSKTETIVRHLHWRDFEILVDLILQQAGCRRVSELGGAKETLDLELESAVANDRYGVQVKSQAGQAELDTYRQRVRGRGFRRCYFVVHSPLAGLESGVSVDDVQVLGPAEIAEWSVKYGLVDWIIDRAG